MPIDQPSPAADSVIDPALREDKKKQESDKPPREMASPRRQQQPFDVRHPSPPPVTTLPPANSSTTSHSPSPSVVSVDRSSNSTPHVRRSPPQNNLNPQQQNTSAQQQPIYSQYDPRPHITHTPYGIYPQQQPFEHHHQQRYDAGRYDPQPRYDPHPHHQDPRHQPYPAPAGLHHPHHQQHPAHFAMPMQHPQQPQDYGRGGYGQPLPGVGGMHGGPMPPMATIVHTDDAATKLTDGIRRRCFNCCTTDTSTWRRSNLSPGKVLCNKCGLFERTHSRPRPDQFPHKRGPLASSTSASTGMRRTPPPPGAGMLGTNPNGTSAHPSSNPHPSSNGAASSNSNGTVLPPLNSSPYQYHHSSLTPLNAPSSASASAEYHGQGQGQGQTLPGIQSWVSANGAPGGSNSANGNGNGEAPGGAASRRGTLGSSTDSPRMGAKGASGHVGSAHGSTHATPSPPLAPRTAAASARRGEESGDDV